MPPETVAWAALALTGILQAVGIGVVYGIITTKLNGVRRELNEHKEYPPTRGHAAE